MQKNDEKSAMALLSLADPLPKAGKTMGYVRVPFSRNDSAYGFIASPITVIANGDGPTALLLAGTQGDEFEGQIALSNLAREIEPDQINGRIIIFPMANTPAAQAGVRNSPIDGLNLNRIFPGDVRGRTTSMLANYIERALMPESEIVVDLHSGGNSLEYLPCVSYVEHRNADESTRRLALAVAFGASTVLAMKAYEDRSTSGAARRAGTVRISAEIGGGGRVSKTSVDMAYKGVRNVLDWAGILPFRDSQRADPSTKEVEADRDYHYALHDGLFEPWVSLGDHVKAGQIAGLIHDVETPGADPQKVYFAADGTVVCLRSMSMTKRGDCVLHLAQNPSNILLKNLEKAKASTWLKDSYKKNSLSRSRRPGASKGNRNAP